MHRSVSLGGRPRPCRARAGPEGKPQVGTNKPVVPSGQPNRDSVRIDEYASRGQELLPKLLNEQDDAAASGNELSKIAAWAGELGNKAQQALAELQRSVSSLGRGAAQEAEEAAKETLEGVSAAIADSNKRFESELAAAADKAAGIKGEAAAAASSLVGKAAEAEAALEAAAAKAAEAAKAKGEALLGEAKVKAENLAGAAEGALAEANTKGEELLGEANEKLAEAKDAAKGLAAEAEAKGEGLLGQAKEGAAGLATEAQGAAEAKATAVEEAVEAAAGGATAASAPTGAAKIEIAVTRQTAPGQDVWIVGSAPALGEWDLDKALALAWTEGHVWRGSIEADPSAVIEYKAVLKTAGGPTIWEGGDNKKADASAGTSFAHTFQE